MIRFGRLPYLPALLLLLLGFCFFSSCSQSVDFLGFFYSESTPDERFTASATLPHHSEALRTDPELLQGAPEDYSFAVLSDGHIQDSGDRRIQDFIQREILGPDGNDLFILDCGDSTQSGSSEQFMNYRNAMDSSGLPWFQSIGNHELYFQGWTKYRELMGKTVYTIEIGTSGTAGSLLIICLDTGNSTLGGKQMEWLEKTLDREQGQWNHTLVFTHANFFSTGLSTVVQFSSPEETYRLMNLFTRYDVDLVISGHNHKWDERVINGVGYITLSPLVHADTSYLRVAVEGDSLTARKISYSN